MSSDTLYLIGFAVVAVTAALVIAVAGIAVWKAKRKGESTGANVRQSTRPEQRSKD